MESVVGFEDLVSDVVEIVLSYLDTRDLCSLSTCSKRLFVLVEGSDVWRKRCLQMLCEDVTRPEEWNQRTWKDLWVNVMEPWGPLIGMWVGQGQGPYGSLVHVTAEPPKISGSSLLADRVSDPVLKSVPFFEVSFDGGGDATMSCHRSVIPFDESPDSTSHCPHECKFIWVSSGFRFVCKGDCDHGRFERRNRKVSIMNAFVQDSNRDGESQDERLHSFYLHYLNESLTFDLWLAEVGKSHAEEHADFKRLEPQAGGQKHILEGIYKGSYASHGVEFVSLRVSDDSKLLVARKLTGDPHIWSGSVTFQLDLETQDHVDEEFVMPEGVEWREGVSEDDGLTVFLRARGEGMIAEFGMKNPTSCPVELIGFKGEGGQPMKFAIHWETLEGIGMFEKLSSPIVSSHLMSNLRRVQ
ncbi:F-box domain-containing protein [Chloropicon primus]|uniref:F-box domain-containing protein n=1 Tax=Chloropicon primus TaxID=1764295 RepID=A0A5B8MR32_9CHLO|nr:hypothetical protein A3770_06p43680 [Chloropicon primus]UPR01070.1 F-box domain-containing protein [Chloropicon primus]|mmetsp:Transcript_3527/g.9927  ORF Transcript_3527/g.9927 Transcript_3527/m.9927 type:complete len:412 (+) Transcript_3527:225-1460(+)|eukprot:QDZ21850.1 hypothetical protein A3770_06p43680 [Chloropicon primus]